jgi:hypothetical protein
MLKIGVLEVFYIYSFTMKLGPRPNILGFTYILAAVVFTGALLLLSDILPFKVLHFSNFILRSYTLKELILSA